MSQYKTTNYLVAKDYVQADKAMNATHEQEAGATAVVTAKETKDLQAYALDY